MRKEKPLWELSKAKTLKTSNCYIVRVNGVAVPVYSNMFFSFANIVVADFHCPVQVEIIAKKNYTNAVIRPLDHEEITEIGDRDITIVFSKEGRIVFEPDGILTDALYILVSRYIPCPAHCSYKFEKGHIYNIGHLKLQSGDVMYIESGAIVSGTIESSHADNLLITGNGILYNGNWHKEEENGGEQMMLFTVGNNIQIEGITLLLKSVNKVQQGINPKLTIGGIFFTMYDSRTRLAQDVVMQVKTYFKDVVFSTIIPRNVRLSEAPSRGLPICSYDPECAGAKSYKKLAEEIMHRG